MALIRALWFVLQHSDKVMVKLLERSHPDVPWKNLVYAAKHS